MYIIPFFCNNVSKLRAFGAMTTYNFFAQSLGDFSSDIKCANSVKPTSRVMVYEKHGNPAACASIPTTGKPSNLDGKRKQSIAFIKSGTSFLIPKNLTYSVNPSWVICF